MKKKIICICFFILLSISCGKDKNEIYILSFDNLDFFINRSYINCEKYLKSTNKKMLTLTSHELEKEGFKIYRLNGKLDSIPYIVFFYFLNEKTKGIELILLFKNNENNDESKVKKIIKDVQEIESYKNKEIYLKYKNHIDTFANFSKHHQIQITHKDIFGYNVNFR